MESLQSQTRQALTKKLTETGEKDKLKQFIRDRLSQSGWRDDLKQYTIEYIKNKGLDKITVDEIVSEIAPRGRAMVPESLKSELLTRIKEFSEREDLRGQRTS